MGEEQGGSFVPSRGVVCRQNTRYTCKICFEKLGKLKYCAYLLRVANKDARLDAVSKAARKFFNHSEGLKSCHLFLL